MKSGKILLIGSIVLLSTILLVGCGTKNRYIGYWAEDEGIWDGGHEITINDDGTFMEKLKDPTASEHWGKWTETDKGISLIYDKHSDYNESVLGHIDDEGFLIINMVESSHEIEYRYRKQNK